MSVRRVSDVRRIAVLKRSHALLLLSIPAISWSGPEAITQVAERNWNAKDSIAVSYLTANPVYPFLRTESSAAQKLNASPDGRYFFFTTSRGDLDCDCNRMDLQVFAAQTFSDLSKPPLAFRHITMQSSWPDSQRPAISQAHWSDDGESIVFVGVEDKGAAHVYRLEVASGKMTQLTRGSASVTAYLFSVGGNSVVFAERQQRDPPALSAYPVLIGLNDALVRAMSGLTEPLFSLYAAYQGADPRQFGATTALTSDSGPWTAPDGRHAMFIYVPAGSSMPTHWKQYDGIAEMERSDDTESYRHLRLRQYMLVNIEQGNAAPVFDAPAGSATLMGMHHDPSLRRFRRVPATVLWSRDSEHAILASTALPLTENLEERRRSAYVVDYDVSTGQWQVLESIGSLASRNNATSRQKLRFVAQVSWRKVGEEFLIEHTFADGRASTGTVYRFGPNGWASPIAVVPPTPVESADTAMNVVTLSGQFKASVKESQNEPFTVIVSDGRREVAVTGPDPALQGVRRARVDMVEWPEQKGRIAWGGLLQPGGSERTGPAPLTIQVHALRPGRFLPDGPSPEIYAAQPLVGAGLAVLVMEPAADGVALSARIDAAVDVLVREGIVDPTRIGLVGASDSSDQTLYVLTHPGRTRIAAAIQGASRAGTYDEYLLRGATFNSVSGRPDIERLYGGAFWSNKASWLQHELTFNVDRVRPPVMFSCSQLASCNSLLMTIGAFRLSQRPFELVAFPQGGPELHRPRERLASLQATVDWMAFWLQGHEDGDPEKAEMYKRWRDMRRQIAGGRTGSVARSERSSAN